MFPIQSTTEDSSKLYVDDVFSSYLYSGNSSTQTINNGIDLAGNGGVVWVKSRNTVRANVLLRGSNNALFTNTTSGNLNSSSYGTFTSTGFTVANADDDVNLSGTNYTSQTFRKAPKFFDVVTWTGNGVAGRQIPHSLGVAPGMIVVKRTDLAGPWFVSTKTGLSGSGDYYGQIYLNTNAAASYTTYQLASGDVSTFTLSSSFTSDVNVSGATYVAYLFAHDVSTDGLIQCGSFTTDASGNATVNTLGWEPQWGMFKASSGTGDWIMLDQMRGWNMTANDANLAANTSAAEVTTTEYGNPTATGFEFKGGSASTTYIYTVIRRPNKPPTTGTDVFSPNGTSSGFGYAAHNKYNGNASPNDVLVTFPNRTTPTTPAWLWADKLRGYGATGSPVLNSSSTDAEATRTTNPYINISSGQLNINGSGASILSYRFARAPGFMDVVCYKGTGADTPQSHNLGAVPGLVITKDRGAVDNWRVSAYPLYSVTQVMLLNSSNGIGANSTELYRAPTSTQFSPRDSGNTLNSNYIAYLFASTPGISKIGIYTGNGSSQTINCGFSAGARFILIKRTDSTGNWIVADSSRGIVSGNDPALYLNSTAAEVTGVDWCDPDPSGFIINQESTMNANVNGATYIFLAIS